MAVSDMGFLLKKVRGIGSPRVNQQRAWGAVRVCLLFRTLHIQFVNRDVIRSSRSPGLQQKKWVTELFFFFAPRRELWHSRRGDGKKRRPGRRPGTVRLGQLRPCFFSR